MEEKELIKQIQDIARYCNPEEIICSLEKFKKLIIKLEDEKFIKGNRPISLLSFNNEINSYIIEIKTGITSL